MPNGSSRRSTSLAQCTRTLVKPWEELHAQHPGCETPAWSVGAEQLVGHRLHRLDVGAIDPGIGGRAGHAPNGARGGAGRRPAERRAGSPMGGEIPGEPRSTLS